MTHTKNLVLMSLLMAAATDVRSHDFTNTTGATVVASYDLSGTEIWHGYFMPAYRLLAEPMSNSQEDFRYINHPPYTQQTLPVHRLVCELQSRPGNGDQDRCKDEFPHVHIDDFKMALNFANELCASHGMSVIPEFEGPSTFVGIDNTAAFSHHYFYQLAQGITFNCVALAVE